MQTAGAGRADVHARPLAHRLQAFQHLDLLGAVGGLNLAGVAHTGQEGRGRRAGACQSGLIYHRCNAGASGGLWDAFYVRGATRSPSRPRAEWLDGLRLQPPNQRYPA